MCNRDTCWRLRAQGPAETLEPAPPWESQVVPLPFSRVCRQLFSFSAQTRLRPERSLEDSRLFLSSDSEDKRQRDGTIISKRQPLCETAPHLAGWPGGGGAEPLTGKYMRVAFLSVLQMDGKVTAPGRLMRCGVCYSGGPSSLAGCLSFESGFPTPLS